MRRRITIAILGMVAAALVLAGLGTLALTRVSARTSARRDLVAQAEATSALLDLGNGLRGTAGARPLPARQRLARVREALKLEDVSIVLLDAQDQPAAAGDTFPAGLTPTGEQLASLHAGEVVSGTHGQQVYAMAPLSEVANLTPVLVLTRNIGPTVGSGWGWFLVSSAVVLVIGALVAARLSRRLTQPLRDATAATAAIAHGDLSTRVPAREGHADELADLARSINEMADSLQRSRGLEQQFLLSVSHDLRTPLTSIQGYAEAIADGAAPDDQAAAGIILTEARRLGRLVRDLLDLAKLESRQFTFHLVDVDLAEVVGDAADGFRPDVSGAGLRLDLVRPVAPVWGRADPDRVAQVVANLVENARKFAASTITVSVLGGPSGPEISVSDDGPGIAPADLPHVFERLYVAGHEPVRAEVGSGLGLAIVRELVESMGGRVWAEAGPQGGARLVVHLPPAPGSTASVPPAVPPAPPAPPPPPPYSGGAPGAPA